MDYITNRALWLIIIRNQLSFDFLEVPISSQLSK